MTIVTTGFTHRYQRPDGWTDRTIYAEQDRVMVAFADEAPYALHHMRTVDEAAARVREIQAREIEIAHEMATNINWRFDAEEASAR